MNNDFKDLMKDFQTFLDKHQILFGVEDFIENLPQSKENGLKRFAGGSARKVSRTQGNTTTSELAVKFEKEHNIFSAPLENEKNIEVVKILEDLVSWYFQGQDNRKRIENGAQAVVRNQILRGDYGHNSSNTIETKGFDRILIDTAQFFNSIIGDVDNV